MDEMNEFFHEEPLADAPMEGVMPELDGGLEQLTFGSSLGQEPIPGPEIPAPGMNEMEFDPCADSFLSSVSELKSSVI